MKYLKFKCASFSLIFVFALLLTGCSKQQKDEPAVNNNKQKESAQQKNTVENNSPSVKSNETGKDNTNADKEMLTESKGNIDHKMIKIPSAQCEICQGKIEKALGRTAGVRNYKVDVESKLVHVNFDKTQTNLGKIEKAITLAGYDANDKLADPDAYSRLDKCCKKPEDRK